MSQPRVSRSRSHLTTVLTTAAVVAVGPALVSPAGAAPPTRTVAPVDTPEPVTPDVRALRIPEVQAPQQRMLRAEPEPESDDPHAAGSGASRIVAATGERSTESFSMVGVTWEADAGTAAESSPFEAQVRVRDQDGWTQWQHLHTDADGPDTGAGTVTMGTAPLWVGEADGVQARMLSTTRAAPRNLEIALIDPGEMPGDDAAPATTTTAAFTHDAAFGAASVTPASTATAVASTPSRPAIVSRRGWGADERLRERCSNGRFTKTINVAFVHHTAGSNSYSRSSSDDLVRGIYAYHTRSRGWCDIGYNFLVDKWGRIFEGRFGGPHGSAMPVYGAHTGGYNNRSFGVSLMGNFETARPTAAMKNATARVIAWKLGMNYRNPRGFTHLNGKRFRIVSGHRDGGQTACPGYHVYRQLPWLRDRAAALIGSFSSPIYNKWQRLGGRRGLAKGAVWGEHPSAGGTAARFRGADIYYKRATGAHEVHGSIRRRYRQLGAEKGRLRFPTTDEIRAARPGSKHSKFQGGRIYWSKPTGTHEVYGRILRRYIQMNAAAGRLKLPKTGERDASRPGSRYNTFQGGRIYWSKPTGAHEVYGEILKRYRSLRSAAGRLRLPTTGEYRVAGGRAQKFQGGRIRWDRSSNTTRVTYY